MSFDNLIATALQCGDRERRYLINRGECIAHIHFLKNEKGHLKVTFFVHSCTTDLLNHKDIVTYRLIYGDLLNLKLGEESASGRFEALGDFMWHQDTFDLFQVVVFHDE